MKKRVPPKTSSRKKQPTKTVAPEPEKMPTPSNHTKKDQVICLLKEPSGASLPDLMKASGWQAHSVRGFISGTVKKRLGLAIVSETAADGIRRYRIVS